jgi:uncharacterized protein (TIGR02246 family)
VGKLPQESCDAWAKHDGHALAKIMAEDVDFVTVATTHLHGRPDFETFHVLWLPKTPSDFKINKIRQGSVTLLHGRIPKSADFLLL